jgi:hypothetical protein
MFLALFSVLVSQLISATVIKDDCVARKFEPEACKISEKLHKIK